MKIEMLGVSIPRLVRNRNEHKILRIKLEAKSALARHRRK